MSGGGPPSPKLLLDNSVKLKLRDQCLVATEKGVYTLIR